MKKRDYCDSHKENKMPADILMNAKPRKRAEIVVDNDALHETILATIKALADGDSTLFQRGGELVAIQLDAGGGMPSVRAVPVAALPERLAAVARFRVGRYNPSTRKVERHSIKPPSDVHKGIHARGHWPGIPRLMGITATPLLRPNGTLFNSPGYDPETGYFFHTVAGWPEMPSAPTLDDARRALCQLFAPFSDFPFENEAHRSSAVATVLTIVGRSAIDGPCPGILVEASTRGTGKSLVTECFCRIATGGVVSSTLLSAEEEERKKAFLAVLRTGQPVIVFDDVAGSIGGPALNMLLTSLEYSGRDLGLTQMLVFPVRAVVFFTANNPRVIGDTTRRILPVRLLASVERPEERGNFEIPDLRAYVTEHRRELAVAALTVLRAWFVAGQPDMNLPNWGSFEAWSRVVRNALVWAGWPDPFEARTGLRAEEDAELAPLEALHDGIAALCRACGGPVTAKQVATAAASNQHGLADALASLPGRPVTFWDAKAIGYRMRPHKDRVVAGRTLVLKPERDKDGSLWLVQPAKS